MAQHPLTLGTRVTRDHVKVAKWPADTQVPGAFATVDEVVDRGVIAAVEENEPLTEAKLAPLEAGAGLPPSIPPGMRAVSVKVNEVVGVAGFVVPGTRVDVMVTLTNRQAQQESITRVVVSNVQVLTAGTRYDQENAKDGKPIPSTVVTLLVSPEDGERIALAASEGQIMLTLRNPLDTSPTATAGVRTAGLFGQPARGRTGEAARVAPVCRGEADPTRAGAAPAPKFYTVEAIRGGKRIRGDRSMKMFNSVLESQQPRAGTRLSAMLLTLQFAACRCRRSSRAPALGRQHRSRPQYERVVVTSGRSTVVPTDFDVTRIAITNPEIADAVVVQPREILVDGKKAGHGQPDRVGRRHAPAATTSSSSRRSRRSSSTCRRSSRARHRGQRQ